MFYGKKKRIYPFRENVLQTCVIRCTVLFLAIFTEKKIKPTSSFLLVDISKMYLDSFLSRERDLECLRVWKHENNNKVMGFKDELKLRLLDVLLEFSFLLR